MKPVRLITGSMAPLDRADVDTDQIMPKQFLKRIERTGFGQFIFHDWRAQPGFVLNDERYAGASVLVAGPNFGCGSSREHAPWGLQQYGFEAIVAPSFADIFRGNCATVGLLCVELAPGPVERLMDLARRDPAAGVRIDLPRQTLEARASEAPEGPVLVHETFGVDAFTKRLLLEGLDEIALTLVDEQAIAGYERRRPEWLPTTR
ncbi:MAG: 3-isopropylmalate dehydratase small subunit [Actinomycetota bacterium]|nr:3-isopropylmalate dehydratase small subunit [Actinomycetota bacterium]